MVMQEQVVFVTGASRGFGQAATRELVHRGHRVVATMRNPERDGPDLLADRTGNGAAPARDRVAVTTCDVTDPASVEAAVAFAQETFGHIDAVFNNAGYGLYGMVEELADDEVHRQFDTNLLGQIRVVRAVAPGMRARGKGKIVNISSLAGRLSGPLTGLYAASKHAVEATSEALRLEMAGSGVEVTILQPGMYVSDWQTSSLAVSKVIQDGTSRFQGVVEETLEAFRARAATRPGSRAVAVAVADIVELEQPLPMRWPVGEDTQELLALRNASTDSQWEEILKTSEGYRSVFFRAIEQAAQAARARG
jgi:NAD(P)-dependent dehydrogenase (short-subunit alcohol dehydrogenase family)